MRIVYTAIFGGYDELNEPLIVSPGVRYICFTDQVLNSKAWELVNVKGKYCSVKNAREVKLCLHKYFPFFTEALWIDANQIINVDVNKLFDATKGENLKLLSHPWRNCVYREAEECIRLKKDNQETIIKQINKYKGLGYPVDNGMVATGLMIRKNVKYLNRFFDKWFEEIRKESKRDQLSFNFVLWTNKVKYSLFDWQVLKTNFIRCNHK